MASQRKFDPARGVCGQIVEQRQPAPGRFIRRYGAKLRMVRLSRLYMNIADGRRQVARGLFRRVANPQPVAHIKGEGDRQLVNPTGGLEALHRRQLAAVGLIVFHHQRHAALAQDIAQGVQIVLVGKAAQRELQPQRVKGLRFLQKVGEARVERAVSGKQGFRCE